TVHRRRHPVPSRQTAVRRALFEAGILAHGLVGRTTEQTIPQTDTDGAGAPGESHVVEEARD
ncbi:glycosyltransferase WbuB, partial [Streptomyces kronopolitis]